MKKLIRSGILSLVLVFAFMFTTALAASDAVNHFSSPTSRNNVFKHGISIQAKHNYDDNEYPIIHISKHDLTLQKGKSETLKATLLPGGKSVSVEWYSSNPKIAKVSSTGKITAVAPGTTIISAYSEEYSDEDNYQQDQYAYNCECYVTVPGGAKDAKPLGINDWTFSYEKTKLKAPITKHNETLTNIKKSIGGYTVDSGHNYDYYIFYTKGLLLGSKDTSKAHTIIYISELTRVFNFGFLARGQSPIKTNRGITIGTKKSIVQQKYGLPTFSEFQVTIEGKTCEVFCYQTKAANKALYTCMTFYFQKSKNTVSSMTFSLGINMGD